MASRLSAPDWLNERHRCRRDSQHFYHHSWAGRNRQQRVESSSLAGPAAGSYPRHLPHSLNLGDQSTLVGAVIQGAVRAHEWNLFSTRLCGYHRSRFLPASRSHPRRSGYDSGSYFELQRKLCLNSPANPSPSDTRIRPATFSRRLSLSGLSRSFLAARSEPHCHVFLRDDRLSRAECRDYQNLPRTRGLYLALVAKLGGCGHRALVPFSPHRRRKLFYLRPHRHCLHDRRSI